MPSDCGHIHTNSTFITTYSQSDRLIISRRNYSWTPRRRTLTGTGWRPCYGWLALGTALLGLSVFDIGVPTSSAIHALTAGAIAVMIVAVMPRVALGHTGRDLIANRTTVAAFVLINAAAVARVCASWHTVLMATLLLIAGALWIAAFLLFELVYGPMLLTRRAEL